MKTTTSDFVIPHALASVVLGTSLTLMGLLSLFAALWGLFLLVNAAVRLGSESLGIYGDLVFVATNRVRRKWSRKTSIAHVNDYLDGEGVVTTSRTVGEQIAYLEESLRSEKYWSNHAQKRTDALQAYIWAVEVEGRTDVERPFICKPEDDHKSGQ